jgi:uncharacterized membrane protein
MGQKKDRRPSAAVVVALPPAPRRGVIANIRGRIIAGLLLALPFFVTFWIVYWLYQTLDDYVISPAARLVVRLVEGGAETPPSWFTTWGAPLLGLITVGLFLYFLGFFARTRFARLFDQLVLRLPIVTSIYSAVSRMFQALGGPGDMSRFKRVVLVSFPHPGMRSPGFVTASLRDQATGKTILCIYVPTTPIPTSGYMLMVPEEEVTELCWTLEETIQAVVSFGLSAPETVQYFPLEGTAAGAIDAKG